jgi:hypothetical protein
VRERRALLGAVLAAAAIALPGVAAAGPDANRGGDERALQFERDLVAAQLALAREGPPYFFVDAVKGELRLLVSGITVSRFPAEKHLVGGRLKKALARRDPGSPLLAPFHWAGLDESETGGKSSLGLLLDPPLRIDFEASPSDFFWRWLRFTIGDRFTGGGKNEAGMNLVLFYHPDSLAEFAPLLADSLDVLVLPSGF